MTTKRSTTSTSPAGTVPPAPAGQERSAPQAPPRLAPGAARSIRRRPRHQVTLMLLPGAEPWVQVRSNGRTWKLPAACAILELLDVLADYNRAPKRIHGEVYVRIPARVARTIPHSAW